MKKMFSALAIVIAFALFKTMPVYAMEESEEDEWIVQAYTEVIVSATVPEGFNEDIFITLEESVTLIRGGVYLSEENGYTGSTMILGGCIYNTYVRYANNGNWTCDIAKQYEVPNGGTVSFSINVTDGNLANNLLTEEQPEASAPGNAEVPHGEDIDPLTNLVKGEVAIQNFIDKVSFIQNDDYYQKYFLLMFGSASNRELYLENNTLNTEEKWNSMTDLERFIWAKCFYEPEFYLYKNAGKVGNGYSVDDFLDDVLCVEKSIFNTREFTNEEVVYEALVEMCEWHYSYFLVTGTVYDYYYGAEYVLDTEKQEVVKLEEVKHPDEGKQLEELQEEVMAELTEEEKEDLGVEEKESNKIIRLLKNNIFTILLLIAVGVALVVLKRKNRDSGIYDGK